MEKRDARRRERVSGHSTCSWCSKQWRGEACDGVGNVVSVWRPRTPFPKKIEKKYLSSFLSFLCLLHNRHGESTPAVVPEVLPKSFVLSSYVRPEWATAVAGSFLLFYTFPPFLVPNVQRPHRGGILPSWRGSPAYQCTRKNKQKQSAPKAKEKENRGNMPPKFLGGG